MLFRKINKFNMCYVRNIVGRCLFLFHLAEPRCRSDRPPVSHTMITHWSLPPPQYMYIWSPVGRLRSINVAYTFYAVVFLTVGGLINFLSAPSTRRVWRHNPHPRSHARHRVHRTPLRLRGPLFISWLYLTLFWRRFTLSGLVWW